MLQDSISDDIQVVKESLISVLLEDVEDLAVTSIRLGILKKKYPHIYEVAFSVAVMDIHDANLDT